MNSVSLFFFVQLCERPRLQLEKGREQNHVIFFFPPRVPFFSEKDQTRLWCFPKDAGPTGGFWVDVSSET